MSVKASPFPETIEDVIGWLETQNPTDLYNPGSSTGCILCAYIYQHGGQEVIVGLSDFRAILEEEEDRHAQVKCPSQLTGLQEEWMSSEKRDYQSGARVLTIEQALEIARKYQGEVRSGSRIS